MNSNDPFKLKRSRIKVTILTCVFVFGTIFLVSGSALFIKTKFFNNKVAKNTQLPEEEIKEDTEQKQTQQASQSDTQPQTEETEE